MATRDATDVLFKRVNEAEGNFTTIQKLVSTWTQTPLFERKDGKAENLLDRNGNFEKRKVDIKEAGEKIVNLLEVKTCNNMRYIKPRRCPSFTIVPNINIFA